MFAKKNFSDKSYRIFAPSFRNDSVNHNSEPAKKVQPASDTGSSFHENLEKIVKLAIYALLAICYLLNDFIQRSSGFKFL